MSKRNPNAKFCPSLRPLPHDFADPGLSDVEVRLSGGVGDGESDWLSIPVETE